MTPRELGLEGERRAQAHLQALGYRILARNWRCQYGELDLVAQAGQTVVFVEVKTRHRHALGAPEEAVTPRKIGRLVRSAQMFLAQHDLDVDWRVDVIAIEVDRTGSVCRFDHIEDATRGW